MLGTLEENCRSTERFRVTDLANRANLLRPAEMRGLQYTNMGYNIYIDQ